jgi:hypothetical protein
VIDLLGSSGGNATISAATLLQNDGAIYATADKFTDKGGLSGIGTTHLQDGSKMEIKGSVSSSATISFDSGTGSSADHLNLDLAELFSGATINFTGAAYTSSDFSFSTASDGGVKITHT